MMLDFPISPTPDQVFDKWTWNGSTWELTPVAQSAGGGGSGFTYVTDVAPPPAKAGDTWFDLSTAATGGTSWVAIEEAPGGELVWVQFAPGTMAPLPVKATPGGAWRSGPLVIVPNNYGVTAFATEDFDNAGIGAPGGAVWTIPEAGVWAVTCGGDVSPTCAAGVRNLVTAFVSQGHNPQAGGVHYRCNVGMEDQFVVSLTVRMNAGQYVQIMPFHQAPGNLTYNMSLSINKVADF